jgi:hypothetical protein
MELNEEYYESLDKRTKEYKEWKEKQELRSQGLGDDIAKAAEATGLNKVATKVAEALGFNDCGCDERKAVANRWFPYDTPKCLEEEEYFYLKAFYGKPRTRITGDEQRELFKIHNRIFKQQQDATNCAPCVKRVVQKLERVLGVY